MPLADPVYAPSMSDERPALAAGVQLVGELKDSGFTEQQWLIQRDQRFVQVTGLLYRVLEQCDGERTVDEIADRLTESTRWAVSREHVRHMLDAKLIPLGLIAGAAGSASLPPPASPGSLLSMGWRVTIFGQQALEPIARALQVFYAPFLLVPMLVAVVAAQVWLYAAGGVVASAQHTLYTPGALLLVLGLLIAGAVFHEFGHAAALRYGGGTPRSIGAGLYILYPAFFTDVTDGYRLSRWARVRTDLGGVYFHLIFASALVAAYAVSRQPLLPFAVLLIQMEVVRQLLPFVRLDGYWLLADLTGIPDFFSQTGLVMNRMTAAALKPWARTCFLAYLALTIPLLVVLFVLIVLGLPHLLLMTWTAMQRQFAVFAWAVGSRDVLAVAAVVTQLAILAVAPVATTLLVFGAARAGVAAVARRFGRSYWRGR